MSTKKTTARKKKGDKTDAMVRAANDSGIAKKGKLSGKLIDHLDDIRPDAKKASIDDVLGKALLVKRMELRPGMGPGDQYASFHFNYKGDPTGREYFLNSGGVRIVPTVEAALQRGVEFPIEVTIDKVGKVYDFVR